MSSSVPRETQEQLAAFLRLVERWNVISQIVGRGDVPILERRHLRDSLALLPHLGQAAKIGDCGSGAGFPGLVLALATGRHVTLIESNARKVAFLREAARVTAAPVTIHCGRIEAMTDTFDLMTARAVAPLTDLLDLVHSRLKPDARCLFPKGRMHRAEIASAICHWSFDLTIHKSAAEDESVILEIGNVRRRSVS